MDLLRDGIKIRTTSELSTIGVAIGAFLGALSIVSLFFVKTFTGAGVVLLVPLLYAVAVCFVWKHKGNALVMNVIGADGVCNRRLGSVLCDLSWEEIGDFGVAEVKKGMFKGKYIYMSRVFVQDEIRRNVISAYDPRVCIVLPYTSEVSKAIANLSCGKIDLR